MTRQPTTDLYFRNVCAPHITPSWARWLLPTPRRPIRCIADNAFTTGDTASDWLVLIRRDRLAVMRAALAWPGKLAYVIDDDIAGAVGCDRLPEAYRARLARFDAEFHRPLVARADALLVASDALAEIYRAMPASRAVIHRITPVWREPYADQRHFAPLSQGGMLRMVHLGSGSHAAALADLAPVVLRALDAEPRSHLTYIAASPVHPGLEAHPRARRIEPKPWREFRRWLGRQRFHLALYPLLATRFDRARSANKLFEHAIVGAVGLYPEDWVPARRLAGDLAGDDDGAGALFAPAEAGQWEAALQATMARREELSGIAATAARMLAEVRAHATQAALWRELLGVRIG